MDLADQVSVVFHSGLEHPIKGPGDKTMKALSTVVIGVVILSLAQTSSTMPPLASLSDKRAVLTKSPHSDPDGAFVFAKLSPNLTPTSQPRQLSLEDRIAYQRAIEEVYWRHRIWPKERPDRKPSLDELMPPAQLEKEVKDYLRNSEALEDYWREPLGPEQLQAEIERMVQHTKQPELLREIFEALGNDPFVIAECLARPALSERLVRSFYAHDERFHGELKQHAKADLQMHPTVRQMKQTTGKYSEMELIKGDSARGEENLGTETSLKLNSREWDENVKKLGAMFATANPSGGGFADAKNGRTRRQSARHGAGAPITQIKTGVLSPLQEDEERYFATAVVKKSHDRLKLAMVEWRKEPFDSWRARSENQTAMVVAAASANYTLPAISDGPNGCSDDTWTSTSTNNVPSARSDHTAVWTGSEMIVWGGFDGLNLLTTGARYNPSMDSWTATSTTNAPSFRHYHTAVWTGSEMIVWGGGVNTGGRYNPGTDTWVATSTTNAPTPRSNHTAVWTGSEMIVWGGYNNGNTYLNTGGRYNPGTDTWVATSTTNAPSARSVHTAVWTGSEMIVWGGLNGFQILNTGGRYNPITDSWTATGTSNAPDFRAGHTAVWTGYEMIVWGGFNTNEADLNTGGRYDPGTDSWTTTEWATAPSTRASHTAVWTGYEMIVWGGYDFYMGPYLNTGGRYNPRTDSWTATSTTNAPSVRSLHTAVWTGNQMRFMAQLALLTSHCHSLATRVSNAGPAEPQMIIRSLLTS